MSSVCRKSLNTVCWKTSEVNLGRKCKSMIEKWEEWVLCEEEPECGEPDEDGEGAEERAQDDERHRQVQVPVQDGREVGGRRVTSSQGYKYKKGQFSDIFGRCSSFYSGSTRRLLPYCAGGIAFISCSYVVKPKPNLFLKIASKGSFQDGESTGFSQMFWKILIHLGWLLPVLSLPPPL